MAAAARSDSIVLYTLAETTAVDDIARIKRYEPELFAAMKKRLSLNGSRVVTPDSALIWFEDWRARATAR